MDAGKVETLLILGVNPVYTAPHDFDFPSKLKFDPKTNRKKVKNVIHVSSNFDETSEICDWHVGESHYVETWWDASVFDDTLSAVLPLIAPLYRSHFDSALLMAFSC